jgi:hypothetical protein
MRGEDIGRWAVDILAACVLLAALMLLGGLEL